MTGERSTLLGVLDRYKQAEYVPSAREVEASLALVVEFGRHAVLRGQWREPSRFESGPGHESAGINNPATVAQW